MDNPDTTKKERQIWNALTKQDLGQQQIKIINNKNMSETMCSGEVGIHYLANNKSSEIYIKYICSNVLLFAFPSRSRPIIIVNTILKKS